MENQKPYLAMLFVQLVYAGMALFSKSAIGAGMSPFVFVAYRQAIAAVVLAPFAYFLERITLGCNLFYLSLRFTTATFAAASSNLIPGITFLLAVLLRMESVRLRQLDGLAKLMGSVVCVTGAFMVALYKGPPLSSMHRHLSPVHAPLARAVVKSVSRMEWIKGCFIMLAANTFWAVWLILQGTMVRRYPAKLRLTALQCLFSAVQSFALAMSLERKTSSWKLGWDAQLLSVAYCGVVVTGVTYWLQVWCVEKKGPVFTAAFTPLALVITAAFSMIIWNEPRYWGRYGINIGGALLIVGGLYLVLWGKSSEGRAPKGQGQEAKEETRLECNDHGGRRCQKVTQDVECV